MDTKTLTVGQPVGVKVGCGGCIEGRVVQVTSVCVYVETRNGRFRFNKDGKECGPDGKAQNWRGVVPEDGSPLELDSDPQSFR